MKKNKYYFYLTFFLVLIGFIYSSVTAYKYIEKYDILKNINGNLKNIYFFEKEGGTPTFWHEASKIKREITDKPFIETGNKYEFNYLPSRIIYFYYNLIGEDIKIKDKFKTNNSKFGLIILQNFLYFVSLLSLLYVLFKKYSYQNIFSIIGIAFFLSFEPTLNQWNRILYSESIFFSFQIILLAILISYDEHSTYKTSIIIGVLVSLMYLQRSISIYYLIIIFFYFYVFFRKKFAINLLIIITIYTLTHIFIGFSNYKRDGKLYFMPILAKEDLYGYFIPKILKYHKDENFVSNFETRHDRVNNIILNKNLNSENEINIEDRLSVANNNFAESLTLIIEYPLVSLKEYGLSLLHYVLLKPNEIHYLIENTTLYDGQFYNSKKFNDEKVIKIIYSIIIYSISLIGLIYLIKKKENRIIFLLFFSILYFSLPVVWHKQSSYLAPSLIYISIFFGFGTKKVLEVLGFKKNE